VVCEPFIKYLHVTPLYTGQVHHAVLHDGSEVAVKVQYPGVAKSIDSDIRNLMSLISVMAILPEGLFIDNIAKHMKVELGQECDYLREAGCGEIMGSLLAQYTEYCVPTVHKQLCSTQVLTTQYITGIRRSTGGSRTYQCLYFRPDN